MLPPLLFSKYDVFSVFESQREGVKKAIRSAPEAELSGDEDAVIARLAGRFGVQVPRLLEDQTHVSEKEVDVDVSRDYRRAIINPTRPFFIKGTEVSVHTPFEGEAVFFDVRPSTFSSSPPRGFIENDELRLLYTFPNDSPPPNLKVDLDRAIADIRTHLERLRESAATFEQQLPSLLRAEIQQRQKHFASKAGVLASLGLPRAPRPQGVPESGIAVAPKGMPTAAVVDIRATAPQSAWTVFVSHASEDKQAIAKPLVDALISAGLSVWYDEYSLRVGDSLRRKIDEGLSKSQFGIVILSKSFFGKHWPEQELNGLAAREVAGKKVILPVWHDVSRDEVVAASPMLADRLGVPTSMGIDKVVSELLRAME